MCIDKFWVEEKKMSAVDGIMICPKTESYKICDNSQHLEYNRENTMKMWSR
jgi:hypothetical protein